jgi:hypothetical protein
MFTVCLSAKIASVNGGAKWEKKHGIEPAKYSRAKPT